MEFIQEYTFLPDVGKRVSQSMANYIHNIGFQVSVMPVSETVVLIWGFLHRVVQNILILTYLLHGAEFFLRS